MGSTPIDAIYPDKCIGSARRNKIHPRERIHPKIQDQLIQGDVILPRKKDPHEGQDPKER
jgi:hypothetical protein